MPSMQWILILGASSGMGAATARAFAQAGYGVFGVHMDRRATMPAVNELVKELRSFGVPVQFENGNAANADVRARIISTLSQTIGNGELRVLMHSLAFGTLRPYVATSGALTQRQLEMTLDVMANSLVYWTQDLLQADLLREEAKIFAMTSSGSIGVWPSYGAVSAAKSALESHIRQLALELAPKKITANAILAGVTLTPALDKIPGAEQIIQTARTRNPSGRLTLPIDVAQAILALSATGTHWITGNTIRVDGGETITG
jgi:enoyl-[acyl-carrier protein] reductase III